MAKEKVEFKEDVEFKENKIEIKEKKKSFNKSELLRCSKYSNNKDILNTLLIEDVKYTLEEVDKMIEKFMKSEAK